MTTYKKTFSRLCSWVLLAAMLLCFTVPGSLVLAAQTKTTLTEDFSSYSTGAVDAADIPAFTFGASEHFTIEAVEGHGNVLKAALGSEAAGNVFDLAFSSREKRITFDFMLNGTIDRWNGLYLFLNTEGTARVVASTGGGSDYFLQDASGNNPYTGSKGFATGIWYTMVIEYLEGALRFKTYPAGGSQAAWDYDGANIVSPADYSGNLRFLLLNGANSVGSISFDNFKIEKLPEEAPADAGETFESYTVGAVDTSAMSQFAFAENAVSSFSIVEKGTHGKVLKGVGGSAETTFDLQTSYRQKRITFDFMYEGSFAAFNGLYFTPNVENTATVVICPGSSVDLVPQQNGANTGTFLKGFTAGNWYTVVVEFSNAVYNVKAYAEGTTDALWDYTGVNAETPSAAASGNARFIFLEQSNRHPNIYLDNILVEDMTTEVVDVEPEYAYFSDDFSSYDYGTLSKASGASAKYSLLRDTKVVDPVNDSVSKVLALEASSAQPQFNVACTLMDKQVQFDFYYDHNFVTFGGIYVTMHREPNNGGDYYFSITPSLSTALTVSVGSQNLGAKNISLAPENWYTCKSRLYDGKFWIKVWPTGADEPSAWDFQFAVPGLNFNAADECGIMAHENGSVANTVFIDNFSIKTWDEIVKEEYEILLNVNDAEAGTVEGAGTYLEDGNATVTAVNKPGYRFVGWTENGETVSTDKIYRFMVSGDRTLTAEFVEAELIIRSFMAGGMTQEAVIDEANKEITVRLASDVDMKNVLCYFYNDVDTYCSVEPYSNLDLSSGELKLGDWTVHAIQNKEMARFYVNGTRGDDANDGLTCRKAFKTIQKAIDAAKALDNWTGDVVIKIANGNYVLGETLKFQADNAAEKGYALILEGADTQNTVISSGITLTGWTASETVPGAWEIDAPELPDGIDYSRDLYINGKAATLARGDVIKLGGWNYTDRENMEKNDAGYLVDGLEMSTWRNQSDIEFVYEIGWTYVIVPVDHVEAAGADSQVVMNANAYKAANEKNGLQIKDPSYIQNALALLDEPGEWYFDRQAQKIYYIPESGVDPNTLTMVMPTLDQLVDADGTDGNPVYGLTLKNLAFRYASYLKAHTDGHADIQANFTAGLDYLEYPLNNMNKTPGAVTFDYAEGIRVEGCSFSCLSAAGLDYSVGVSGSTIVGNRFEEIGASGIQVGTVKVRDGQPMSNYGFADGQFVSDLTPEPNRITHDILVLSNVLDGIGTRFKGAIAIMAGYTSDVTIAHNTISNTSYTAISAGWGWGGIDNDARAHFPSTAHRVILTPPSVMERYVIENNDISNIMLELHDGGGIYTLSDMPGSIISGNVVKDSQHIGIYNDEASGGFAQIAENITVNAPQPYFYHNVRSEYADRMKATENVMRDNYWNTVASGETLYDGILTRAGVLAGVSIPALPADVPASGDICTYTLTLNAAPAKTAYTVGEQLNLTGLDVTLVYASGETEAVTVTEDMVSGFDSTATGTQTITVTYAGQTVTFDVTVQNASTPSDPVTYAKPFGGKVNTGTTSAEPFLDVKSDDWFAEDVAYVVKQGIMNGLGNQMFAPDRNVTRGMVVTILWRMEQTPGVSGESIFRDVAEAAWYTDAVIWAGENAIVTGYGNGKFGPDHHVTREQLAALLYRYAKYIGRSTSAYADLSRFQDADAVSDYAKDAMSWAVAEGLINGADGKLMPRGQATRAQIAAIIHRFLKK